MEKWTTASPAYVHERLVGFKLHFQFAMLMSKSFYSTNSTHYYPVTMC